MKLRLYFKTVTLRLYLQERYLVNSMKLQGVD